MSPYGIEPPQPLDLAAIAAWNQGIRMARLAYWADQHCVVCGIRKRDGNRSICWTCRKNHRKVSHALAQRKRREKAS